MNAIDGSGKTGGAGFKIIVGLKQRLKYPSLERQIDLLKAKLEQLKADLMVMLNVLIYGGQLRRQISYLSPTSGTRDTHVSQPRSITCS